MSKVKNNSEYYVVKIRKSHVDWLLDRNSLFRSIVTLFVECFTVLGVVITLLALLIK